MVLYLLAKHCHCNNTNSSDPRSRDVLPFTYIIVNAFKQRFIIFRIGFALLLLNLFLNILIFDAIGNGIFFLDGPMQVYGK